MPHTHFCVSLRIHDFAGRHESTCADPASTGASISSSLSQHIVTRPFSVCSAPHNPVTMQPGRLEGRGAPALHEEPAAACCIATRMSGFPRSSLAVALTRQVGALTCSVGPARLPRAPSDCGAHQSECMPLRTLQRHWLECRVSSGLGGRPRPQHEGGPQNRRWWAKTLCPATDSKPAQYRLPRTAVWPANTH